MRALAVGQLPYQNSGIGRKKNHFGNYGNLIWVQTATLVAQDFVRMSLKKFLELLCTDLACGEL